MLKGILTTTQINKLNAATLSDEPKIALNLVAMEIVSEIIRANTILMEFAQTLGEAHALAEVGEIQKAQEVVDIILVHLKRLPSDNPFHSNGIYGSLIWQECLSIESLLDMAAVFSKSNHEQI